eukprot:3913847-Prymnesium_polylepis.1
MSTSSRSIWMANASSSTHSSAGITLSANTSPVARLRTELTAPIPPWPSAHDAPRSYSASSSETS